LAIGKSLSRLSLVAIKNERGHQSRKLLEAEVKAAEIAIQKRFLRRTKRKEKSISLKPKE